MTTPHRPALIIGGGIAGPAMAMALQKAGIDSVVYEAQPTSADGVGAFLTLGSNGVDGLRVLGADQPALAAGFATPSITLRSWTGKRLGAARTGRPRPDGTTSQTIKRADLYQVLTDEATRPGLPIEHGKRLVAAEDTGDGVRAVFTDGTEAVGDMLIGSTACTPRFAGSSIPPPLPAYAGLLTNGGYARGVPSTPNPAATR